MIMKYLVLMKKIPEINTKENLKTIAEWENTQRRILKGLRKNQI